MNALNQANRARRIVVDAFSPTGWCLGYPPHGEQIALSLSKRASPEEELSEPNYRGGLPTRPFGLVLDDPPAGRVDNPPRMNLFFAGGVGNLRDPRVGNIMTLDTGDFYSMAAIRVTRRPKLFSRRCAGASILQTPGDLTRVFHLWPHIGARELPPHCAG